MPPRSSMRPLRSDQGHLQSPAYLPRSTLLTLKPSVEHASQRSHQNEHLCIDDNIRSRIAAAMIGGENHVL